MKYIYIKVDTNDGDYIAKLSKITEEQILEILPVIYAIKDFKSYTAESCRGITWIHSHNFPTRECHRDDLGEKSADELYGHLDGYELFLEIIPYCAWGINAIEEILILDVNKTHSYL